MADRDRFHRFWRFYDFQGFVGPGRDAVAQLHECGQYARFCFLAIILLLLCVSFGLLWVANVYLQEEQKLYERIISATPDIILLVDKNGIYSLINDTGLKKNRQAEGRCPGQAVSRFVRQGFYESVTRPNLEKVFDGEIRHTTAWMDMPAEGRRYKAITYHPVSDSEGRITFAAITIKDITDFRLAQEERQRIFELSLDMLCVAGMDGYFKELNPAWTKILGWSREELMASPYIDFVHPDDRQSTIDSGTDLMEGKPVMDFVNRYRTKHGSYKYISWASYPEISSKHVFAVARDVSDRVRMEKELKEMAAMDPLTGADNRRSFLQRLTDELARSLRYQTPLSLVMMDIDHFKSINDNYGHPVGDKVLKDLVDTCKDTLRSTDIFGRLGGEEFSAVLPHTPIEAAHDTADRLRIKLGQRTIQTETGAVNYTISAGVTELRPDEESIDSILMRADQALYRAKNSGRNKVEKGVITASQCRPCPVAGETFFSARRISDLISLAGCL